MSDEPTEATLELLASAKALLMGASDDQLIITLAWALNELFNYSNCWIENIGIMVVPNTLDYPVQPITGKIIRLQNVIDQNNVPQAAVMPHMDVVRLCYPINQIQPMVAIVSKTICRPFRDGRPFPPHVPQEIYRLYGSGILDGVVGRMMVESGQTYSDAKNGGMRLGFFRTTISLATASALRMNVLGGQAWAFPQQFRVTSQRGGVSTFNLNPSSMIAR